MRNFSKSALYMFELTPGGRPLVGARSLICALQILIGAQLEMRPKIFLGSAGQLRRAIVAGQRGGPLWRVSTAGQLARWPIKNRPLFYLGKTRGLIEQKKVSHGQRAALGPIVLIFLS